MKKALASLLLLPAVALADSWSIPNQHGGEIVITDRTCQVNGKSYAPLKEAYTHWNGGYLSGCWLIQDDMVKIIWQKPNGDPDTRVYRPQDFVRKSASNNTQPKPKTETY